MSSDVRKFADDMKTGRLIKSNFDVITLQAYLDKMNKLTKMANAVKY